MRRVLPYLKKYKWHAIGSPIMMIIEVMVDIITPFLMAKIVNEGIASGNSRYVIEVGILMIVLSIFGGAMGAWSSHLGATAGYGAAGELRKDIFRKIQQFSFNNIDTISVPSLITRVTTDVDTIGMVIMMSLRMAFRAPFLFLFALIFAIRLDTRLSMIFVFVIPVLVLILIIILRKVMPFFKKMRERLDDVNEVVREQLEGIRVIKSFNRQTHAEKHFETRNTALKNTSIEALRIMVMLQPAFMFMIYVCMLGVLWLGGNRVLAGNFPPGNIIAFITYIIQILMAVALASMYIMNLTYGLASLRRINEVLDTKSELVEKEQGITEWTDSSVEFKDVCFKYPEYRDDLLEEINLYFPSGSRIGIIGATGSSKTTLVQMIPRLYDVDLGSVEVGGINVKDYDLTYLRNQIGYVLQKNILVTGTIRSNMQWGNRNASDEEIISALKRADAWEFVSRFPDILDHEVDQGGSNFSGGQKQRLTIARTLLKNPKILILDDSTSAVDTATDRRIRNMLRTDFPETTLIIIAQRIDSISDCDKIVVLEEGDIVGFDTHENLLKTCSIYKEIVESQERTAA